jgi:hypothetical protein
MKPKAEDTEWEEEEEVDPFPIPWRGDKWFNFYWIADVIVEREGVSRGVAERTLRELCATGDVRSIRCDAISSEPEEPEIIRPSEWVKDQVDLADDGLATFVSAGDVQYWLDKQALAAGRPKEKFHQEYRSLEDLFAAAEQEQAASTEPVSASPTEPTLVKARTSRKLGLARTAVKHLWPQEQKPPEALTNPQIEKQVDDWITGYCRKNNIPKPDIGRDTILRAAGRRQQ